jgi:transcriptional/translational regulatory protein YebC/TACO1
MFQKLGVISLSSQSDEDRLMDAAIEAGADDVITHDDGSFEVLTPAEDFMMVRDALVESGFPYEHAEVTLRADNLSPVNEKDAEKVLRLLDVLEDLDDVQNVYSNADYPDEIMNSAE